MQIKSAIEKQITLKDNGLAQNRIQQKSLMLEVTELELTLSNKINKLAELRYKENMYIERLEHLNKSLEECEVQ